MNIRLKLGALLSGSCNLASNKRLLWLSCILLFAQAFSAQAAMYKWYDEKGKVNYSQAPPP
ncbi:MAG: DUF4124 domain-containing protein, partial [Candidatus Thiodiazotropha sp. (ex Rostrolucina anterorostrata)]|nr:DUF4124 domain-containing protein [Candidatus Thiodiazotropha sp. (ex Rostrolucina anterorostrata)]